MGECASCGELGERVVADLEAGETLPPAARQLVTLAGGNVRRCPTCHALFLYTYDYEYGALGDGWEDATLERIDRERAIAVLLEAPPSTAVDQALTQLGVVDGRVGITKQLLAALDEPTTSYEAARKLVVAFVGEPDAGAIGRLLRHSRAKVRADTLYLLQQAPRDLGAEPLIIPCLDDPDPDVRSKAAWTLAVFAEDKRDISASLPALAARVVGDPSIDVRTVAARALVGAANASTDCSGIVTVVERLDPTDELRTKVLDAIHAAASRTRRERVFRCPKCGSTNAGPDESRSAYEFTYMQCLGCGDGGLVDSWQRDCDWVLEIEVPLHATELPSHVSPLAPGLGVYDRPPPPAPAPPPPPPAPPPPPPPAPPVFVEDTGCARCFGADAAVAWSAIRSGRSSSLISELRSGVDLETCTCGQQFAVVFTERVNYLEGEDEMTWLALPISRAERARLVGSDPSQVPGMLVGIDASRRFLARTQVGASVDAWWRDGGFSIDPSFTVPAAAPPAASMADEPRVAGLLSADEVAELFALGVPLDAACLRADELRIAIASQRVKRACSSSSMGTAETYWGLADRSDSLADVRLDGVVLPPGEIARETPYEQRVDDRDVDAVLWAPFFREQCAALLRRVPADRHGALIDHYAHILAGLEDEWAEGSKRIERAPFLERLVAQGPVDEAELDRWLVANTKRSVRHLVQGIRARWLTHDVATAFDAVMASVDRFKHGVVNPQATRLELLRCAVRVMRGPVVLSD